MAGQPKLRYKTATIDISVSTTISDIVDVGAGEIVGLIMPSVLQTGNITFQAAQKGSSTFLEVRDADNNVVTVTSAAASKFYTISFIGIKGLGRIKLVSATT